MAIPLLLLTLATLSAAVVAYGTHPGWGGFEQGLQMIVWSRRFQWPLVALAVMLCLMLIGLVILGRRRAWWLIGLGPILALFVHHFAPFAPDRAGAMAVLDNPTLIEVGSVPAGGAAPQPAAGAAVPADDDWVVGVRFGDTAYAYPYAALFRAPVVFQSEHGNRMVLLWSAYANRALAFSVTGAVRARDLEVVSVPANALLVYDTRRGQFINGLKGLTLGGRVPTGFAAQLLTTKTTWKEWRSAHPGGKVMAWDAAAMKGAGKAAFAAPTRPLLPAYTVPGRDGHASVPADNADRPRVTVVGWPTPAAVDPTLIGATPVNLSIDGTAALLFKPGPGSAPRAFALPVGKAPPPPDASADSVPRFVPAKKDSHHPEVALRETASDTLWTADGAGIPHTKSARDKLKPLAVDEDVDRATLEYWYPSLHVLGGE